jgi:hypothetical protein
MKKSNFLSSTRFLTKSLEDVEKFLHENNIPYNALHDRDLSASGASPVHGQWKKVQTSVQEDGGGKREA